MRKIPPMLLMSKSSIRYYYVCEKILLLLLPRKTVIIDLRSWLCIEVSDCLVMDGHMYSVW